MIAANAPHSATPKNIDPLPWQDTETGQRIEKRSGYIASHWTLNPRPEYSQNREDYP